ncbi:MAG TPA: imidazole glycerol phosphate synthase subunit HisH [bacterium]
MITIVDYGMGNLRSVQKAFESLGAGVRISSDPREIDASEKLVLPGVGSFPAAMRELDARGLIAPLMRAFGRGTPYLGICLGLQLLFESSDEGDGARGLGVLKGRVRRFPGRGRDGQRLKIPHMGWNQVRRAPAGCPAGPADCPLLRGVPEGSYMYFVHSHYAEPEDASVIELESHYGAPFASMIRRAQLYATQFHPEKSQRVGLTVLENFARL